MIELFNKILNEGLTPNQCYLLFSIKNKTTPNTYSPEDYKTLIKLGYIKDKKLTNKASSFIKTLDNYFKVNKSKTQSQLLGKNSADKVALYREIFPPGKLPSGVPSRNNVKILTENFRWFFSEYDYSWEEIIKATKMYVNEYRLNDYMYMQNSQYFISKQDKHKVKTSKLADYCDMIRDGITTEEKHFKEKVV